jgi:OCT family organic cation transporter-like MFS transporter 4/5
MLFVGALFGFFVIPYMADNYGRQLAMRVSWGLGVVSLLIFFVSDSPNMVGLSLFLVGFSTNPAITLTFSFVNEICLGRSRSFYGVGMQIAWAIGEITIALIFLMDISWRYIAFLTLVSFIVVMVIIIKYVE